MCRKTKCPYCNEYGRECKLYDAKIFRLSILKLINEGEKDRARRKIRRKDAEWGFRKSP